MKLLNRLREIWAIPPDHEMSAFGGSIEVVEMDFEEFAFQQGMENNQYEAMVGIGTLDGLRQRISGVHEDFPPGLMGQGEDDSGA